MKKLTMMVIGAVLYVIGKKIGRTVRKWYGNRSSAKDIRDRMWGRISRAEMRLDKFEESIGYLATISDFTKELSVRCSELSDRCFEFEKHEEFFRAKLHAFMESDLASSKLIREIADSVSSCMDRVKLLDTQVSSCNGKERELARKLGVKFEATFKNHIRMQSEIDDIAAGLANIEEGRSIKNVYECNCNFCKEARKPSKKVIDESESQY